MYCGGKTLHTFSLDSVSGEKSDCFRYNFVIESRVVEGAMIIGRSCLSRCANGTGYNGQDNLEKSRGQPTAYLSGRLITFKLGFQVRVSSGEDRYLLFLPEIRTIDLKFTLVN